MHRALTVFLILNLIYILKGNTMPVKVKTNNKEFNSFYNIVEGFLNNDVSTYIIDGEIVRGYRSPDCNAIWLRDHVHQMKGYKYFESDMKSAVKHFFDYQAANGRLFDFVRLGEKEDWLEYTRVPAESDVEYLSVQGVYNIWQVTGDDEWIKNLLSKMELALRYSMTSPWRWSEEYNLIKRPFTIDTWDFHYVKDSKWLNFNIDDNTHMCIFHGDNSGFFDACNKLSRLFLYFGDSAKAGVWKKTGEEIRNRTNELCWNGSFYTHMIHLDDVKIPGLEEKRQLSLSNPYDINRDLPSHEMAVEIIKEYRKRKEETGAFAEWFSITPPFPEGAFSDPLLKPGVYCNGGIMPLVGGELAKAAFDHGYEEYGAGILKQYISMVSESNETYLWYFPNGEKSSRETSTSPDALPTDGWGSAAMLYAFTEGLCGVEDKGKLFNNIKLSPRWIAAGINNAEVDVSYSSEKGYCKYKFEHNPGNKTIKLEIESDKAEISAHVLLPENAIVKSVKNNNREIKHSQTVIEKSIYADFQIKRNDLSRIEISLK